MSTSPRGTGFPSPLGPKSERVGQVGDSSGAPANSCPGGAPVTDSNMRVFSTRGSAVPTSLLPAWQVGEAT